MFWIYRGLKGPEIAIESPRKSLVYKFEHSALSVSLIQHLTAVFGFYLWTAIRQDFAQYFWVAEYDSSI